MRHDAKVEKVDLYHRSKRKQCRRICPVSKLFMSCLSMIRPKPFYDHVYLNTGATSQAVLPLFAQRMMGTI